MLLRTDNAAVSWMKNLKHPTGQVARCLEVLGTYNLTVTHRPGLQHRNAYTLSRTPCTKCAKQQSLHKGDNSDDDSVAEARERITEPPKYLVEPLSDPRQNSDTPAEPEYCAEVVTRHQLKSSSAFMPVLAVLQDWSPKEIETEQNSDPSLSVIIQNLQQSKRPTWQEIGECSTTSKSLWRMWDRISLHDCVLF